ncbi:MAG: IS66 family insertion sequence element accessory protein TnpB [Proteobacteria bacterium]|nr:IS66 family insertion sequence element accessory protein TnpB [Pseudomonadota bacterium]MBU1696843.1 IS66 family insertion sequence element accessory protein TnpB [Pseudomonadota bacterium]
MSERFKKVDDKRGQFWRHHINEWSGSGLTQNAYCRGNNLKPSQLTYWKNKFKRQNLPVEFVQVSPGRISEAFHSHPREVLRLNVESGFQIEVPDGFSQTTLTQVLEVLRGL